MGRTELLRVSVKPRMKVLVEEVASTYGQTVSEFVREAVEARIRHYLKVDEVELRRRLAALQQSDSPR